MNARSHRAARAKTIVDAHKERVGYLGACAVAADELGIGVSGIRNLLYDPDGSKQKARRKRYQGSCQTCGSATDGSNGKGSAPGLCEPCYIADRAANAMWTREGIIAAVQRWARQHGRPPTVDDWRPADPGHAYPNGTDTYGPRRPFDSWAEVIEAAGFPRPVPGKYKRTAETRRRMSLAQKRRYREQAAA